MMRYNLFSVVKGVAVGVVAGAAVGMVAKDIMMGNRKVRKKTYKAMRNVGRAFNSAQTMFK